MDGDLVRGLRSRGVDVITAFDADMIRRRDKEHLEEATVQRRVLYSFNVGDFHGIHSDWLASSRTHCGMVLTQQKRYSVGEQIRQLVCLVGTLSAESMRNGEEFLSRW